MDLVRQPHEPSEQDLARFRAEAQALAGAAGQLKEPAQVQKHYRTALKVCAELAGLEPDNRTWKSALAVTMAHMGKYRETESAADELCRQAPHSPPLLLVAARCYAVCAAGDAGRKRGCCDKAIRALAAASTAGYRDVTLLRTDPELSALPAEAGFRSLVEKLGSR